jgi:pimeloyl-ACP methyl ester carboxylesterase
VSVSLARPTLLLVHGAWHGTWCWEKVEAELASRGWRSQAVDLPSAVAAESNDLLPSIFDDAQVIRAAIDGIDGPVVVVAHSYGGVPVTQATAGAANVVRLVYLSAFSLDMGESLLSFVGAPQADPESVTGVIAPRENPAVSFYGDVSDDLRDDAVSRLVYQSGRSFVDQITRVGWRTIPSSYIVCDNDQSIAPEVQEKLAARTGAVYHLPSSHSPFLSMPGELTELLIKIAA